MLEEAAAARESFGRIEATRGRPGGTADEGLCGEQGEVLHRAKGHSRTAPTRSGHGRWARRLAFVASRRGVGRFSCRGTRGPGFSAVGAKCGQLGVDFSKLRRLPGPRRGEGDFFRPTGRQQISRWPFDTPARVLHGALRPSRRRRNASIHLRGSLLRLGLSSIFSSSPLMKGNGPLTWMVQRGADAGDSRHGEMGWRVRQRIFSRATALAPRGFNTRNQGRRRGNWDGWDD